MAVAEEKGLSYDAVLYTKNRPSRETLEELVSMLEDPAEDLVRKDSKFKAYKLNADDYVNNPAAVVDILDKHIALLQRPVIVRGKRAIVGRPRSRVGEFLS